ncbi:MAG: 1-acyl-sn-glycerol-3-phosphate acyltransferase [Clostridia bacterium]|nr:1-acyl-sn-glycerol-3-phosphate acyltransferase [Clostridia bacterium]
MELNKIKYKRHIKPFDTSKKPIRSWKILSWVAMVVSKILTRGKIGKLEKINMEGLKPPYILLSNHQTFTDFEINAILTYPEKFHSIATFEGHYGFYGIRAYLMEKVGCIPKRKFTTDPHLVSSCNTVLNEYGDILSIYPEARYTDIGTTSPISDSYAQLIKKFNKPVVAVVHRGNYLRAPFWNWQRERKVKTYTTMKKILDPEDIERMSCEEIIAVVRRELWHDEHQWQKDNNIIIDEPWRAEGLHKALYQCPHCLAEHRMLSKGNKLWCVSCGKEWEMTELGELRATSGKTEFSHIPDWYNWEKENVRREVEEGRYYFEDDVDVYALPNVKKFIKLGKGKLTHSLENGITLEGHYNGEDYKIVRPSRGLYSIHTEYNYCFLKHDPCIQISIADNTFICNTHKKDVVTKVYFAVVAIHEKLMRERAENKQKKLDAEKQKDDKKE